MTISTYIILAIGISTDGYGYNITIHKGILGACCPVGYLNAKCAEGLLYSVLFDGCYQYNIGVLPRSRDGR